MTADQKKKAAIVGVLVLALGITLFIQMKPSEEQLAMQALAEAGQKKPDNPGGTAAATPGPGSIFESKDIDLEELQASVSKVEFRYDQERRISNPMTPKTRMYASKPSPGPGKPGPPKAGLPYEVEANVRSKVISGIVWDANDPIAIVNNQVVALGDVLADSPRVGSTVYHVTVDSIEPTSVIFRVEDTPIRVEMKEH